MSNQYKLCRNELFRHIKVIPITEKGIQYQDILVGFEEDEEEFSYSIFKNYGDEQDEDWRDSDDSWGDYGKGVDCYGTKHLDSRSWFIKFWKKMIKDGREQELIDYISDIWDIDIKEVKGEKRY